MREQISQALTKAQKEQDRLRVATLRLVNAAIQDRDIANRGKGKERADDAEIADLLAEDDQAARGERAALQGRRTAGTGGEGD